MVSCTKAVVEGVVTLAALGESDVCVGAAADSGAGAAAVAAPVPSAAATTLAAECTVAPVGEDKRAQKKRRHRSRKADPAVVGAASAASSEPCSDVSDAEWALHLFSERTWGAGGWLRACMCAACVDRTHWRRGLLFSWTRVHVRLASVLQRPLGPLARTLSSGVYSSTPLLCIKMLDRHTHHWLRYWSNRLGSDSTALTTAASTAPWYSTTTNHHRVITRR